MQVMSLLCQWTLCMHQPQVCSAVHKNMRRLQERARMMLRLNRCARPTWRSTTSRKASVHRPFSVSNEMSTTMLSTRHFSSFTCVGQGRLHAHASKRFMGASWERVLAARGGKMHALAKPPQPQHNRPTRSTAQHHDLANVAGLCPRRPVQQRPLHSKALRRLTTQIRTLTSSLVKHLLYLLSMTFATQVSTCPALRHCSTSLSSDCPSSAKARLHEPASLT